MARGIPHQRPDCAYRGAIGWTQTTTIHVTGPDGQLVAVQVYTSVDAASDPELADRLRNGRLNVLPGDRGEPLCLAVPVVYHDPAAELLVLVLTDAHRHRELEERIAVLGQLRSDPAAVPPYAKDFAVVFGAAGLRALLDQRADQRDAARELEVRSRELAQHAIDLAAARAELAQLRGERRSHDTDRFDAEREIDVEAEPDLHIEAEADLDAAADLDVEPELAADLDPEIDPATDFAVQTDSEAAAAAPGLEDSAGGDPLTTEVAELPLDAMAEVRPEDTLPHVETGCVVDDDGVHLVVVVGDHLGRGLAGALDLRLVLHRAPSYPVIALVLGPPAAMRAPDVTQLAVIPLDVAAERDREVLHALGQRFELVVELVVRAQRTRRCRLTAPLAENVAYVLGAAEDHLRGVAAEGEPDYARARDLVLGAGADLLGTEHPAHAEFRQDSLAQIATAQQLRRALAMARRFTRPAREDYLVCTRSFPLARWHALRRQVLARAVAWGLWMGPELAQVAVSEGLARSRRDLIARLERGLDNLRRARGAFDIDTAAVADNAAAIAGEARALGVERPNKPNGAGVIASDVAPVVSGSIDATPPRGTLVSWSTDELIARLASTGGLAPRPTGRAVPTPRASPFDAAAGAGGDRAERLALALALCDRAEPRAAAPVVAAALVMPRGDAVRVLARATRFGAAAAPALQAGLAGDPPFIRQGCALALARLRSEDSTQAVIDLLLSEPTELWRELARAIGQIGTAALMPLASSVGRLGEHAADPTGARAAWAMAHLGVRGGKAAIVTMAAGQSIVAPIATKALGLFALAAGDHLREPSDLAASERDLAVNHAFSRQFYAALEPAAPGASSSEVAERDPASSVEP